MCNFRSGSKWPCLWLTKDTKWKMPLSAQFTPRRWCGLMQCPSLIYFCGCDGNWIDFIYVLFALFPACYVVSSIRKTTLPFHMALNRKPITLPRLPLHCCIGLCMHCAILDNFLALQERRFYFKKQLLIAPSIEQLLFLRIIYYCCPASILVPCVILLREI